MMHRHERGMTVIGMIFAFAGSGVFALAAVKLAPAYLEYMNVAKALNSLKSSGDLSGATAITRSLEKAFDINDVKSIGPKDVEVTKQDGQYGRACRLRLHDLLPLQRVVPGAFRQDGRSSGPVMPGNGR